jgi:hypothetical protein
MTEFGFDILIFFFQTIADVVRNLEASNSMYDGLREKERKSQRERESRKGKEREFIVASFSPLP